MKRQHQKTLELLFKTPVSGNIPWADIESLLVSLGASVEEQEGSEEREGSRVLIRLFGERRVFHRPHPSRMTDKGAATGIRDWLKTNGVKP